MLEPPKDATAYRKPLVAVVLQVAVCCMLSVRPSPFLASRTRCELADEEKSYAGYGRAATLSS
jgi:hypothetical protein